MVEVDVQSSLAVATLLFGVATYVFNSRRERSIQRADLVRAYTSQFSGDQALVDLFTEIDYERFDFIESEDWLGHKPEQDLVRLLDLFNSIGHNWSRKVLTLGDVQGTTLGYAMVRAHSDPSVKRYLSFVDNWDSDHSGTGMAFAYFRKSAQALEEASADTRRHLRALTGGAETPPGTPSASGGVGADS